MDRVISDSERRQAGRRRWLFLLLLVPAVLGSWVFYRLFRPSFQLDRVRIAVVEQGPVSANIQASGVIQPSGETLLPCPFDARIQKVLVVSGTPVSQGQAILELNTDTLHLDLNNLLQELAIKRNGMRQLKLEAAEKQREQAGKEQLAQLDWAHLQARFQRHEALQQQGLLSAEALMETKLEMDKKKVELEQTKQARSDSKLSLAAQMEALELEIAILTQKHEALEQKLKRAVVRAEKDGFLAMVFDELGAYVREGQVLAKVATSQDFKVVARISDYYSEALETGMPAEIQVGSKRFAGEISRLLPEISDGVMSFEVAFESQPSEDLRANTRVEVFVVTAQSENTLRVAKGPGLNGTGRNQVFVLQQDRAVKREITTGLTGIDYVEILSGLQVGERIIVSDMRSSQHNQQLYID